MAALGRMAKQLAAYGSWKSPITSALATEGSLRFQDIVLDPKEPGKVYWSELRATEGGRFAVCSAKLGDAQVVDWTPREYNARTRVHEYGGGALFVHSGRVYFSNFSDQRMYVQESPMSIPVSLTPADIGWRYADASYVEMVNVIISVREDHSEFEAGNTKEAQNTIVSINPQTQKQSVLVSGANFYSAPRVAANGVDICWIQWNHPNMPWDQTELWIGKLASSGDKLIEGSAKKVGLPDGICVMNPGWSPGNQLFFICDLDGWWNLYHLGPGATSGWEVVGSQQREIGSPHWQFGLNPYSFTAGGKKCLTIYGGELGIYDLTTMNYEKIDTGYKSHRTVLCSEDGHAYSIVGSPTAFPCVVRINLDTKKVEILKKSREVPVDTGYLSIPEPIEFPTSDDQVAHAYLYLPQNKDFEAPEGTLPPLLVKAHGGPTASTTSTLNLNLQYFTSRGFALLDVDYRGSTGYGTSYRNQLRKRWGICDVDDCCHGALYVAQKLKKADPRKLVIDGGSAGGYTTLAALSFKQVFSAGVSCYGICDLEALAKDTHKFESRYLDSMLGAYPEEKSIYVQRSPINHVEKFNCPVAFFQGGEDKIVLPNQAEMMFEALKKKGIPTAYLLFPDEQHGFRKSENVQKALDGEFYFFSRVLGFEPAETPFKLPIENLP